MKIGILFLIDRLDVGGTERQLLNLVRNVDKTRFRPHLGILRHGTLFPEEKDIPHLALGFKSFRQFSTLACCVALAGYIRQNRIGIVQTFFQDPTFLAALSRPLHRAKLIGSFRDLGFWRSCRETSKMRLAYRAYSGFVANSHAVKEHFVHVDRIASSKIKVIHNGIAVDGHDRKRADQAQNEGPLVGIVANLNRPVKRVQDFIRAAALVRRLHPETRFLVVGDGHLRPQLEALGEKLGLGDALTFAGLVRRPMELISRFQVGVITSETEGFCNSILEYMASGVPVVATATGGNLEMVVEGENGFLVAVGDVESMANRIALLLRNDDLRAKIEVSNVRRATKEFSLQKMVDLYERYYESISSR